jgi:hypothetical protein
MIKSPSVCKTALALSEGGAEYRYRLTESAISHSGPGNLAAGTGSKWASRCSLTLKALAPARGKSQLTPDVPGPGAPSRDGELPGPKEEAPQAVLARRRAGPLRGSTSSSVRGPGCSPRGPRTPPCTPLGVDQDHGPHVPRLEAPLPFVPPEDYQVVLADHRPLHGYAVTKRATSPSRYQTLWRKTSRLGPRRGPLRTRTSPWPR